MNRLYISFCGVLLGASLAVGLAPAVAEAEASPADTIIQNAPATATGQLLGLFTPANQLEKDILATALLDVEGRQLHQAAMAGDASARARRKEIADQINAYEAQYTSLRDAGTPFGYQWRVLSGAMQSAPAENLIPPIRELYEARYGTRDAATREQAAQFFAAQQAAGEQAKRNREAQAKADEQAQAACRAAADGTRFDPNDVSKALRWWVARTRELGTAQRSGNQLRIDAARQQFARQLRCPLNQRVRYTFRVQKHPIRNDPAISASGVLVGIYHEGKGGVIKVGAQRDSRRIDYTESAPILLRAGKDIDPAVLPQLDMDSTFVASARVAKTGVLGGTSLRSPTLILFVDDLQVEQIKR